MTGVPTLERREPPPAVRSRAGFRSSIRRTPLDGGDRPPRSARAWPATDCESPLWCTVIVGLIVVTAASITGLYHTPAELETYGRLVRGNSALIVQSGPGYGLDNPTTGAVMMNESSHLDDHRGGAHECVHDRPSHAHRGGIGARRIDPGGARGSARAPGGGVDRGRDRRCTGRRRLCRGPDRVRAAGVGIVRLRHVDLRSRSRVRRGSRCGSASCERVAGRRSVLGGVVLGMSFVLRAVGDVGNGVLSWASPIGWARAIRAYADERWWVLALPAPRDDRSDPGGCRAAEPVRDFGAGLVAQRPGAAAARPRAGPARSRWLSVSNAPRCSAGRSVSA